jgi:hypothetical protein
MQSITIGIVNASPAKLQAAANVYSAPKDSPSIQIPNGQRISNTLALVTDQGTFAVLSPPTLFPVTGFPALTNGQAYCLQNTTSVPVAFTAFNSVENVRVSNLDEAIVEPGGSVSWIFNSAATEASPIQLAVSSSACPTALVPLTPGHGNLYKVGTWFAKHKVSLYFAILAIIGIAVVIAFFRPQKLK